MDILEKHQSSLANQEKETTNPASSVYPLALDTQNVSSFHPEPSSTKAAVGRIIQSPLPRAVQLQLTSAQFGRLSPNS